MTFAMLGGVAPSSSSELPPKSVHRRTLPESLVAFSSPLGRQYFAEAMASGHMEPYFPLIEQFVTQEEPTFCGLGTLTMVMNALRIDPRRRWHDEDGPGWRWWSDEMFLTECSGSLEQLRIAGVTMEEFRLLASANGALTTMRRPTDPGESLHTFRESILEAAHISSEAFTVSSFCRSSLGQTGVLRTPRAHARPRRRLRHTQPFPPCPLVVRPRPPPCWHDGGDMPTSLAPACPQASRPPRMPSRLLAARHRGGGEVLEAGTSQSTAAPGESLPAVLPLHRRRSLLANRRLSLALRLGPHPRRGSVQVPTLLGASVGVVGCEPQDRRGHWPVARLVHALARIPSEQPEVACRRAAPAQGSLPPRKLGLPWPALRHSFPPGPHHIGCVRGRRFVTSASGLQPSRLLLGRWGASACGVRQRAGRSLGILRTWRTHALNIENALPSALPLRFASITLADPCRTSESIEHALRIGIPCNG